MANKLKVVYKDDQDQQQEVILANPNNLNWIEVVADYFVSIGLDAQRHSEGYPVE